MPKARIIEDSETDSDSEVSLESESDEGKQEDDSDNGDDVSSNNNSDEHEIEEEVQSISNNSDNHSYMNDSSIQEFEHEYHSSDDEGSQHSYESVHSSDRHSQSHSISEERYEEDHDRSNSDSLSDAESLESVNSAEAAETAAQARQETLKRKIHPSTAADSDEEEYSKNVRVKRIFGHVLLQGLPVPEVGEIDWSSSAALTTTRSTPTTVLDDIDRDLRFGRPCTVEALAERHGCIRLVVTRRIDHLRSQRVSIPGLKYSSNSSGGATMTSSSNNNRNGIESYSTKQVEMTSFYAQRHQLDHDIQYLQPPVTVRELADKYSNVNLPAIHARVAYLRALGLQTSGIVAGTRGAKPKLRSTEEGPRVLRYFTVEEDAAITTAVRKATAEGVRVPWTALDDQFSRFRGASKQRWLKGLVGRSVQAVERASTSGASTSSKESDRAVLLGIYRAQFSRSTGAAAGSSAADVSTVQTHIQPTTSATTTASPDPDPEVLLVVAAMTSAVQSRALQQSTTRALPSTTTTAAAVTQAVEYSNSTATAGGNHTQLPLSHINVRNFTTEEDELVLAAVCSLKGRRVDYRFWEQLDARLRRKPGSCRGRWSRVLLHRARAEGRLIGRGKAVSASSSGGAGVKMTLYERYCAILGATVPTTISIAISTGSTTTVSSSSLHELQGDVMLRDRTRRVLTAMVEAVVKQHHHQQQQQQQAHTIVLHSLEQQQQQRRLAEYSSTMQRYTGSSSGSSNIRTVAAEVGVVVSGLVQAVVSTTTAATTTVSSSYSSNSNIQHSGAVVDNPILSSESKKGRVLRRFTAEEDALLVQRVLECMTAVPPRTVQWSALDRELGRSTGGAKQRWLKSLAKDHGYIA